MSMSKRKADETSSSHQEQRDEAQHNQGMSKLITVKPGRRPKTGAFTVTPWKTKKQRGSTHENETVSCRTEINNESSPGAEDDGPDVSFDASLDEIDEGFPSRHGSGSTHLGTVDLDGVASIAWLPSGHFSGHFVDAASSRCIGIHGRELLQVQECTRDDEKALLLLILTDFRTRGSLSVAVEKSGGDAVRLGSLEGDSGWQDDVLEDLEDANGDIRLAFSCTVLKSDEEADRYVERFLPAVRGREGLLVTKGTMQLRRVPLPFLEAEAMEAEEDDFGF